MFSLCLCGFSLSGFIPLSTYIQYMLGITGVSKVALGVNVSINCCLSLSPSPWPWVWELFLGLHLSGQRPQPTQSSRLCMQQQWWHLLGTFIYIHIFHLLTNILKNLTYIKKKIFEVRQESMQIIYRVVSFISGLWEGINIGGNFWPLLKLKIHTHW